MLAECPPGTILDASVLAGFWAFLDWYLVR